MRGWLLTLASAGLRDTPALTDRNNMPESKGAGTWVWIPASHVEQDTQVGDSVDSAADDAREEAENEKNRKILAMKQDLQRLQIATQGLNEAYEHANNVASTVAENQKDWGTLLDDPTSLLQAPHEDESKDQLELDESFDGLHALTERVEKANELLKAHMDKIPDTILAPSTLKELKSPGDLLTSGSSFLEEPSGENAADLAEDVREKKWEKKATADLKDVFSGLEEERAELKKKSGVLTKSLDHLASLAQQDAKLPHESAPNPESLVEAARAGHWEWRAHRKKHEVQHSTEHHAHHAVQHRAKHNMQHRVKTQDRLKREAPETTEAEEMKALDEALAPLEQITQSVKAEQAHTATKLSEIAQTVQIENDGNMRAHAD